MTTRENPHILRTADGSVRHYSMVGSYPIFYLGENSRALCPGCVEADPGAVIVAHGVNWENASLYCDECSERIESAYTED